MPPSRTDRSIKNVGWSVITQLLLMLLGLAVRTALVFSLGLAYVGLDAALVGLVALLTLAEAGMGASLMYSMYGPLKSGDLERLQSIVTFARRMFAWVALGMGVAGLGVLPLLDRLIGEAIDDPLVEVYFLILLVGSCSKYLFMHRSLVVIADQRFYITKLYNFAVQALRSILQIVILLGWGNYLAFVLVAAGGSVVYSLVLHYISGRYYPYLQERGGPIGKSERKVLYANVRAMFGYRAAIRVLTNSTPIIAIGLAGASVAGAYANYALIISSCLVILDLSFQSITASIGNLTVSSAKEKVRAVFDELVVLTYVMYGVTGIVFAGILDDLIFVWLGEESVLGFSAALLIALNYVAYGQMAPVMTMREATGQFRRVRWILPVTAAVSVALSLVLGHMVGLVGILLGPVLARLLLSNWLEPLLLIRMMLGGRYSVYLLRQAQLYLGVLGVVLPYKIWLRGDVAPSAILVLRDALALSCVGLAIFLLMFGWSREGRALGQRIRGIVNRRRP